MYKGKTVGVVVPAFNEEKLISQVIETMPDFVDNIVVVDDCSRDNTCQIVQEYEAKACGRVFLLRNDRNQGVGGAIAAGYKWCRDDGLDIAVVMAGDAQMDPKDLPNLLEPVAEGRADFAKGNRLFSGAAWQIIPRDRYLGNAVLSLLTKIASGYWHVADSQCGYTAINAKALKTIDWDRMYKRYGQPNDLLVRLNINSFRVMDVPVRPIYGIGETSNVKPIRMIPRLAWLIARLFVMRLIEKYVIRDFHPLVFFYFSGLFLVLGGMAFGLYVVSYRLLVGSLGDNTPLFSAFLLITGWQFILFAMWFDMQYNRDLK